MNIEALILSYGYIAILLGTFLEGETILILGGLAAHLGYLSLTGVMLAAFTGSLAGDQLFFFLGRRHSQGFIARFPRWKQRTQRVRHLLERYHMPMILLFRFLYGLRTVAPFAMGMSRIPAITFIALNALGALVWAIAVGTGGYVFGSALEVIIGNIKHYELYALTVIIVCGAALWSIYVYHKNHRVRSGESESL
jgi:membrane protein DedA with SNARE-associated domain